MYNTMDLLRTFKQISIKYIEKYKDERDRVWYYYLYQYINMKYIIYNISIDIFKEKCLLTK